jgi:Fe2+ transport system protein FeoA
LKEHTGVNNKPMSLHSIRKGSKVCIVEIPEGRGRMQLVRLGITAGVIVRCIERLPGGTIVVEKNRQEIALGAALALKILVRSVVEPSPTSR